MAQGGYKPEHCFTKVSVGSTAFYTDTAAALRWKDHVLASFSIIRGGEILSAYQYEQQPLEWSCLQSYKAYSTEMFKNLVLESAYGFEEGHKNKWLIHNQGLT